MPDVWMRAPVGAQTKNRFAILVDSQGSESSVVVVDVSSSGFRLESPRDHFVGEQVRLRLGIDAEHPVEIRWVAGSQVGGIFLDAERSSWGE
jgi:hypothetical protein